MLQAPACSIIFSVKGTLTGTHLSELSANAFSLYLTLQRAFAPRNILLFFNYISWFNKRCYFCCQHPLTIRQDHQQDFQAAEGDLLG